MKPETTLTEIVFAKARMHQSNFLEHHDATQHYQFWSSSPIMYDNPALSKPPSRYSITASFNKLMQSEHDYSRVSVPCL
jgi:hypothetical protein